jgi:protein tyrosine phosphatase (PTP) superfamily phosphohydrolase (DUF442 family)
MFQQDSRQPPPVDGSCWNFFLAPPAMPQRFPFALAVLAAFISLISAWTVVVQVANPTSAETPAKAPRHRVAAGLENVWQFPLPDGRVLYSGGQPQGELGFRSLRELGVRTIVSVDGVKPDLGLAKRFEMRYVHVPIGYDDVPADRLVTMIRAVQTLPGPVYVHCHHGRHRGPAAAVCILRSLDPSVEANAAAGIMRSLGTAERYRGLYGAAMRQPPTRDAVAAATGEFLEVSEVEPLTEQMVAIDHDWGQLRSLVQMKVPTREQIDQARGHLAVLSERFRESARLLEGDDANEKIADLRKALAETAEALQGQMERPEPLSESVRALEQRCTMCHARFRD